MTEKQVTESIMSEIYSKCSPDPKDSVNEKPAKKTQHDIWPGIYRVENHKLLGVQV